MKCNFLFMFLFLSGCASLGPQFEQRSSFDKKKSLVYLYRVSKFAGSAGNPDICVDSQVYGELGNGGYLPLEIASGNHKLELKGLGGGNAGELSFQTVAGGTYYLRSDYSLNNGAKEGMGTGVNAGLAGVPKTASSGAIAGGMTAAAGIVFFGSKEEAKQIADQLDTRAHKDVINPGLLMVKQDFAQTEIGQTKLIKVREYKTNPCAPKETAKK